MFIENYNTVLPQLFLPRILECMLTEERIYAFVCTPSPIPLEQLQHGRLALKHLVLGTPHYACLDQILHL